MDAKLQSFNKKGKTAGVSPPVNPTEDFFLSMQL